ncbi:MAG TPA: regulatory iron-sulfur-containing complex subunit RicT [Bacteroidota bacterium]|nr:regulatory iron-sulfur-containing complex subunit RicT [Bacteroidota bacterium]
MSTDREVQETDEQRPVVPAELHKLDDAVLVFTSEEGPVEGDIPAGAPVEKSGCCDDKNGENVDHTPFVEVVFKGERRGYYTNSAVENLAAGEFVIVEAEKGVDLGLVGAIGSMAYMKSRLRMRPCKEAPRNVLRRASDADVGVLGFHRQQERTAFDICLQKIQELDLPMKLVDVEYQFDRNRITFYFTADGRVDFRQLVRELAAEYRTRIELRQIGPRDEAKRMGGFGVCGRELCCSSWLGNFEPISTDMARLQNLTLNPFKLAGQCGRLKCCLGYEAQLYEELLRRFPPLDYRIVTRKGEGKIEKIDIFQDAIYVHYHKDNSWDRLTLDEVHALMGGAS